MSDCRTCPSYMTGEDAKAIFKKDPGAPICVRFGRMLAKPGMTDSQAETVAIQMASSCSSYGEALPVGFKPDFIEAQVCAPDVSIQVRASTLNFPVSCASCQNYIEPATVQEELGWRTGMCAAKGRLLFPNRLQSEAKDCEYGVVGDNRESTEGMIEMPMYAGSWGGANITISRPDTTIGVWTEPTEYVTDKPVEANEASLGIRAWRKVTNPDGSGRHVFLPVFEPTFFDDVEQSKIPRTGDVEHPELYFDHDGYVYSLAVEWMGLDRPPALWGEAGNGKTELLRHMAWMMCVPFVRINFTSQSDVDEFAGKWLFEQGETVFHKGRVTRAWESTCVLCMDEANVAPEAVWEFIRPMTDNSKQLVLDSEKGTKSTRNPFCFFGFAMNPSWNAMNAGTRTLANPDLDRLRHVWVAIPPENIERAILVKRCEVDGYTPSTEMIDKVMAIAKDLRAMIADGSLPMSWGVRPQIGVLAGTQYYDLTTSYKREATDHMEPEMAKMVLDVVSTYADSTTVVGSGGTRSASFKAEPF